ncbi:MAG: FHA domain-containing protein [Sandaracinus sp.]
MAAPPMPSFGGAPAMPAPQPSFGGAPAMAAPQPQAPAMPPPAMAPAPAMAAPPMPSFGGAPVMAAPPVVGGSSPAIPAMGDQVVCPKCGTSNARNFKYCGSCGHPLGGSIPAPAPAAAPPPAVSGGPQRGSLVLIRADGSEGDSFPLQETTIIGRETGGLFASDSYLSPRHATFTFAGGLSVRDENSLNGIYMRIGVDQPIELVDRSVFRIGQEIIRFERLGVRPAQNGVEPMGSPNTGLAGRICLITGRDTTGNCFPVPSAGLHMGRERGDILFPEDGYVSGLHCRLHEEGGRVFLTDVGSSNGTFVRIHAQAQVPSGALLLMGQQLFRVEY